MPGRLCAPAPTCRDRATPSGPAAWPSSARHSSGPAVRRYRRSGLSRDRQASRHSRRNAVRRMAPVAAVRFAGWEYQTCRFSPECVLARQFRAVTVGVESGHCRHLWPVFQGRRDTALAQQGKSAGIGNPIPAWCDVPVNGHPALVRTFPVAPAPSLPPASMAPSLCPGDTPCPGRTTVYLPLTRIALWFCSMVRVPMPLTRASWLAFLKGPCALR